MRIVIANDHRGLELKKAVIDHLSIIHDIVDLGSNNDQSADYAPLAHQAARHVSGSQAERAILICGSGVGMSIAANRHSGVRAAVMHDPDEVALARSHGDLNVLCLSANRTDALLANQIIDAFLNIEFSGGRHQRRIDLLEEKDN